MPPSPWNRPDRTRARRAAGSEPPHPGGAPRRPSPARPAEQSARKAQERVPFEDRDDDDTSPGGHPDHLGSARFGRSGDGARPGDGVRPRDGAGPKREAVKVIAGTRRFHDSDCPLIKGMGGSGVETMSQSEAEDAGLTQLPRLPERSLDHVGRRLCRRRQLSRRGRRRTRRIGPRGVTGSDTRRAL